MTSHMTFKLSVNKMSLLARSFLLQYNVSAFLHIFLNFSREALRNMRPFLRKEIFQRSSENVAPDYCYYFWYFSLTETFSHENKR